MVWWEADWHVLDNGNIFSVISLCILEHTCVAATDLFLYMCLSASTNLHLNPFWCRQETICNMERNETLVVFLGAILGTKDNDNESSWQIIGFLEIFGQKLIVV